MSKEAERCNNATTGRDDPEFAPRRKKRSLSQRLSRLSLLCARSPHNTATTSRTDRRTGGLAGKFFCAAQAGSHSVFFIVSAVVVPLGKNAMRRARRNLVWNGHTAPGPVRSPCQSANRRSSRGSPPSRTTPLSSSSRQQPPVHPCPPPRALPRGSLLCFGAPPLLFILLEKRDF